MFQRKLSFKQNLSKFLRSKKPGTSLLVAMGLTTIIVLVSLGVTTVVVSSIRESANVTGANQAYYAAEGALEKGLLANQNQGEGYSGSGTAKPLDSTYTISGQVALKYSTGEYGIPTPGTGTAAQNCDKLNPDIKDNFSYSGGKYTYTSGTYAPQEHPCNWNKIKVGESVGIPLYVSQGSTVLNPNDIGLTTLGIRVRPPCKNGQEFCDPSQRYDLYYDKSSKDKYNATNYTIMSWQITASNQKGDKSYSFSPFTIQGISGCYDTPYSSFTPVRCEPDNSEIYESQINFVKSTDGVVVNESDNGLDNTNSVDTVLNFLTDQGVFAIGGSLRATSVDSINKPILKLSIIHSLHDTATTTIPYLEYQILTNTSTTAPTDTSQTVTAEGYSGTFKQVLEVKNPQESGLLEYVIQQ